MKYILTCNDSFKAMVRANITVTADTLEEAWEKAKNRFARKYKSSKRFITITAVQKVNNSKSPA